MSKLRSLCTSLASLALAAAVAAACGNDEQWLAGLDAGASSGGSNSGGVASHTSQPDSSASGGTTASGGGTSDASSDAADATEDALGDAADSGDAPDALAAAVPDFHLVDENPASARYKQQVSPRDYLGQVSAWYFGHST